MERELANAAGDDRPRIIATLSTAFWGGCATGARWRDVPEKSGNWHSIYRRFRRWSTLGDADFLRKRRRRPQRRHCYSGYFGRYRR
jgi:hypothetical protein